MKSRIGNVVTSTAFCLPAIQNSLALANPDGTAWRMANGTQERYFAAYGESGVDLESLATYLKSKVTNSAAELVAWFRSHGWDMDVDFPPDGLGIGSIFDLLVDWLIPGRRKYGGIAIRQADESVWYEGVEMDLSQGLQAHQLDGYEHPMFELSTRQDGWKVFLVEADGPCDALDLPAKARGLLRRHRKDCSFHKLEFPFVELAITIDISWLQGLAAENGFRIDEAIKQVKLRLDDKGARAESAVAIAVRSRMKANVYTMQLPFYVVFWREGLDFPAFVALSGPDSWKRAVK